MILVSKWIDSLNNLVGRAVSWLSAALVIVIIADVFLRYTFSITSSASFELEWHLFAAIFLLSAGWTLQRDRHVRVDVFYQGFNERNKAWVNLVGTILLLMPLCIIGCLEGFQFARNAYMMGETSPDPGGLPARYIIKSTIPAGFFLLGLQGMSIILRTLSFLIHGQSEAYEPDSDSK